MKFEKGTYTWPDTNNSQTITLNDGTLTPTAVLFWTTGDASAGTFSANGKMSIGVGTRRGGSTQSGSWGIWGSDNVATSSEGSVASTKLLHVMASETTDDYTITLDSFGAGSIGVTSSSGANTNADVLHYIAFQCDDAEVVAASLGTGATSNVTVSFVPDCVICLDNALNTDDTKTSNTNVGFGFASSSTQFAAISLERTDGDTMTTTMNYVCTFRTDACIDRLVINSDSVDARWDVDSFGTTTTFGAVDAPAAANQKTKFLFLKGVKSEAGSFTKNAATGNQTITLTDSTITPKGVILIWGNRTTSGVQSAVANICIGAADGTRQGCIAQAASEAINTTIDHLMATDAMIEDVSGGTTPAEDSVGAFSSFNAGNFVVNWNPSAGTDLVGYMVFTDAPTGRTTLNTRSWPLGMNIGMGWRMPIGSV